MKLQQSPEARAVWPLRSNSLRHPPPPKMRTRPFVTTALKRERPYLALQLRHLADVLRLQSLGQLTVQRSGGVLLRRLLVPNLQKENRTLFQTTTSPIQQDEKQSRIQEREGEKE